MVYPILGIGLVFLAVAIVAGLFGFGAVFDGGPLVARLTAGYFLLLAAASFGWAWMAREPRLT